MHAHSYCGDNNRSQLECGYIENNENSNFIVWCTEFISKIN